MAVDHLFAQFILDAKNKQNQGENIQDEEQIKNELLELSEQLGSSDFSIQCETIEKLKTHSKMGGTNISQVPKFLKFLFDKTDHFKSIYQSWPDDHSHKKELANLISYLSIIQNKDLDCLRYKLLGLKEDIGCFGIEYVHHLAEDIKVVYETTESHPLWEFSSDILQLVREICIYYLKNNCEIDVVDLNYDLDNYDLLEDLIDSKNISKILNYLQQLALYTNNEDSLEIMRFVIRNYRRFNMVTHALVAACRILDIEIAHDIILKVTDQPQHHGLSESEAIVLQQQLCLMMAHYGIYHYFSDDAETLTRADCEELLIPIHNKQLIVAHSKLSQELEILKPYSPEDVFKITGQKFNAYYSAGYLSDPSLLNLASAMVSALANAAFKTDTLLLEGSMSWMLGQKDHALMSCVAATGLIYMWDIEEAMLMLDKFLSNDDKYVRAGGILAVGIASANVFDPFDSNLAILLEYINHTEPLYKRNAIMSLGLAFAGTDDRDVIENIKPFLSSSNTDLQSKGLAALSIGMISAGTYTPSALSGIFIQSLTEMSEKLNLTDPFLRLIPVGLGLVYLFRHEHLTHEIKAIRKLPGEFGKWCSIIIKICTHAGTGNTVAIQKLMQYLNEPAKNVDKTNVSKSPIKEKPSVDLGKGTENSAINIDSLVARFVKNQDIKQAEPSEPSISESKTDNESFDSTIAKDALPTLESTTTVQTDLKSVDPMPLPKSSSSLKNNLKKEFKKLRDNANLETEMVQGLATIGIALISMNDDVSQKMAVRLLNNLLQFGSIGVKRAVPIAMSLMFASDPEVSTIELLSKLSHDQDIVVSTNAIIGLGIISAGTNNSRVSNLLKNLNIYFYRDPAHLIAIRLAQGLVHLSKGVMSLAPGRAENTFLSPTAIASLLIHCILCLDVSTSYLSLDVRMFFWLVPAMKLRALITYDENMNIVPVTVRVGQAVEEIGQAGKPKKITGFQTVKTPILLDAKDKVELATDKYIPQSHILENIVIVKKSNVIGQD